jgi:hypothetical protein
VSAGLTCPYSFLGESLKLTLENSCGVGIYLLCFRGVNACPCFQHLRVVKVSPRQVFVPWKPLPSRPVRVYPPVTNTLAKVREIRVGQFLLNVHVRLLIDVAKKPQTVAL